MSFSGILGSTEPLDDGFRVAIPPTWHQGRTAYGGLSTALALSAAMQVGRVGGELPPLRSAQLSMIAPLYGEVQVRAELLRRGKNATWISARISGEKGLGLIANFVFMGEVDSALHLNHQPLPDVLIPPGEAAALSPDRGATFLRHNFDVRFALPRRTDKLPEMCWWVRARDREGLDPMVELALIADATPPGVMPLLSPTAPMSTMQWQINMLSHAPVTQDGWWLLRSVGEYARDGCSSQRESIWNSAGEPVLSGIQSLAIFG